MSENKSFLDALEEQKKPESFNQESFITVHNKSRTHKMIAWAGFLIILAIGIFAIYRAMNTVQVPQLAGMTLDEANLWATQNRIILASRSVYDFDIDSGYVISQATKAGSTIQKNSTLTIEVSLGADPAEKITWPDIESMSLTEIEQWIDDNKLTGVKITTANSDLVAADSVISYTLTDDTEENFVRKNRVTIVVSTGPAAVSDTVVVSDFSSMKAGEVLQWGKDNGVAIILTEAFDEYVSLGYVVSQDVKADTEILKTVALTVVISKGKPITVPDFSAMTQEEASSWAKSNSITLSLQQRHSSDRSLGSLISQSIESGASIQSSDEIKLVYSLGKVEVASYIGRTKLDIVNWQTEINAKGGNITLSFSKAYGEKGTADKIIRQSVKNDYVNPGTKINVVISLGMQLLAPDFSGKTESECKAIAQSAGITVLFSYEHSDTVEDGYVISQDPVANTVISDASTVTVVISY